MTSGQRIRLKQLERQAEGYLELGMPEQALETLARVGDEALLGSHGLFLRGEALRELERYEEALVYLSQAAALAPRDIQIWLAMGWCHKRTGRLDLAIEDLQKALAAAPKEALIHYNLACYYSLAGQRDQAIGHLSRALAINPQFRQLVEDERDFDPIRNDPGFQALTSIVV